MTFGSFQAGRKSELQKRPYLAVVGGLLLLGAFVSSAEARARPRPLVTRFVGVFQPYNEKDAGSLQTLTFVHKGHSWLFKVERVNVIGGGRDPGTTLLNRIFPPRLSISGPQEFFASLENLETMGKRFALQGWLDLRVRTFRIVEITEEPAEGTPTPSTPPTPQEPTDPAASQPKPSL